MAQVRFWQPADLPHLLQMAAITAWEILPDDEKAVTPYETVARNAHGNLYSVLQAPGGTAFVADEGGVPVGYLLVAIRPDDTIMQPEGYLADIWVHPAHRRKGISKELHRWADAYMRSLGIRRVTNWTHAHNVTAQNTIAHHGLRPHAVVMVKDLHAQAPAW